MPSSEQVTLDMLIQGRSVEPLTETTRPQTWVFSGQPTSLGDAGGGTFLRIADHISIALKNVRLSTLKSQNLSLEDTDFLFSFKAFRVYDIYPASTRMRMEKGRLRESPGTIGLLFGRDVGLK
ncbi:hypothetical protein VTO42DRAFT_1684 [Malbranchea cinnamomea]